MKAAHTSPRVGELRILWVSQVLITSKPEGLIGSATYVEMPEHVAQKGHKVTMVLGAPPREIRRPPRTGAYADFVYLPMINRHFLTTISFQLALVLLLPWLIRRSAPNAIIIDHFSVLAMLPWALLKKSGLFRCPIILDLRTLPVDVTGWRGRITSLRYDASVRFANNWMDGMTMITSRMKKDLAARLGLREDRIGVWESGADMERFRGAEDRRAELGWADKFVVMYHGVLSPNRGLQAAVAAFARIKGDGTDTCLCLLGAGPAEKELVTLIEQLELEDSVRLLPPVPYVEIGRYLASADVGLIPLPAIDWWNTSSPLKLMEYMAAGKPVIVSRIEAHTAVLGDCAGAYFLESVSPDAIAAGIRYFRTRRNELARLGAEGQEIVNRSYTWSAQADKLIQFLHARCTNSNIAVGEHGADVPVS
jgi:glycosyltransferase involved in cell wall biosynthesis